MEQPRIGGDAELEQVGAKSSQPDLKRILFDMESQGLYDQAYCDAVRQYESRFGLYERQVSEK